MSRAQLIVSLSDGWKGYDVPLGVIERSSSQIIFMPSSLYQYLSRARNETSTRNR